MNRIIFIYLFLGSILFYLQMLFIASSVCLSIIYIFYLFIYLFIYSFFSFFFFYFFVSFEILLQCCAKILEQTTNFARK